MFRSKLLARWFLGLFTVLTVSASLPAVDITFDLTQIPFNTTPYVYSLSSNGYTIQFQTITSNAIAGGNDPTTGGIEYSSIHNVEFLQTGGPSTLSFKSYKFGDAYLPSNAYFNLSGGTGTSNNNTFQATTTLPFNGSYSFNGNPVQLSLFNMGTSSLGDFSTLNSLTFEAVTVPEPSTYAMVGIATGILASVARRRRARRL